jgi:hypothetical protein
MVKPYQIIYEILLYFINDICYGEYHVTHINKPGSFD